MQKNHSGIKGNIESLTEGVDRNWLNSLTDENGNRILPEEEDALQRRIFNGTGAGSQHGYSVSSAGDVNGDGYDDVIVGAPLYNTNAGRAYIYFGGMIMNTVADVIISGAANDFLGGSVASAGDVNGDGYSDVIVGANGYSGNTGRVFIYLGGSVMNNVADVTILGFSANLNFGISVSGAGDVNGDGYSDVIAGGYGHLSNTGLAFVYYGGVSMNNFADVSMTEGAANGFFGISVSLAGDVNGDGYSDAIVGAYGHSGNTGRAYVYFGGSSMNNTADLILTGEAASNFFGYSVSGAGDVNCDGYSDLIAGAYGHSANTGRAYVYYGGASMNNVADIIMSGEASGNQFGRSVSKAGDINGDGFSDVIAGAWNYFSSAGKSYIFFGGTSMNNIADFTITGESTAEQVGWSVSTAGDVNGDGYSDIIVGANGYSGTTGRAYLYDYFLRSEIVNDNYMTGSLAGDNFGQAVSSADVNGDGYSDLIVGAPNFSSQRGRVYIYFGGVVQDTVADVSITGIFSGIRTGYSVSSAGDVNADGYDDVIIGSLWTPLSVSTAYLLFGGPAMDSVVDVTFSGETNGDQFGLSVSQAGDVNGDGYSDIIIGANNYLPDGKAYIYFGGASMDGVADIELLPEASSGQFGLSVSTAGDMNGDGYSDVFVGSSSYSTNTGRTYIYFGGASMDTIADLRMTGETSSNHFGRSISTAGDVNGDGYSDVISGAYGYSGAVGRSYIYYGGLAPDTLPDITMTGFAAIESFGYSVSSAGDVNGDGYSDVFVGANGNTASTGKAYLYFGGSAMNNVPDVTMSGETSNSQFGRNVSSAGDANGDGFSDLIVGAYNFSSGKGRAYLYKGSAISANPVLISVKDFPGDQGGVVNLKWARSSLEANGHGNITNYLVYRSVPPGISGYQWVQIADVTAVNFPFYYYDAETLNDSSSSSTGNTYFLIKARNGNTGDIWNSNVLYGRSIDNISPPMVAPFTASPVSNNVRLNWGRSPSHDLLNYILYRSSSPAIDPETEPVFAIVSDSTYLDTSPLSGVSYYFIVAQDIHNNKSPVAVAESPNITLNLSMFIEGFYNPVSNSHTSDTITVYLRNQNTPFVIVDMAKTVVSSNGSATLKFGDASSGTYFIAVTHRNAIETWSSNSLSMTRGGSINFDFANSASQAFGSNQIQVDSSPVRFAFYSGDVNQDGTVDATDVSAIDNDAANFVSGYIATDLNGDDFADGTDFALADNNAANFVSAVTP